MTFASRTQFHVDRQWGLKSVLNVKAVVATFNQEKAPVGAFFVIVKLRRSFGNLRLKLCCSLLTQQRNANVLRIMILFSTSQVFRKYHNKEGFYRPGRVKVSLHVAVNGSSTICPIISTMI